MLKVYPDCLVSRDAATFDLGAVLGRGAAQFRRQTGTVTRTYTHSVTLPCCHLALQSLAEGAELPPRLQQGSPNRGLSRCIIRLAATLYTVQIL